MFLFFMSETLEERIGPYIPHPNRISAIGGALSLAGLCMLPFDNTREIAPALVFTGYCADFLDGYVARNFSMKTKEGAKLDPLMDKIRNYASGSYMIIKEGVQNPWLVLPISANFVVDYLSQRKRGTIPEQLKEAYRAIISPQSCTIDTDEKSNIRANNYGKWKTALQSVANIGYVLKEASLPYFSQANSDDLNLGINTAVGIILSTSAVLGYIGVRKRS